jgi:hypothetical protein
MLELGERYLHLYHELERYASHPIEFMLTHEQEDRHNQYFGQLQAEQVGLYGDDLIAFVRRLGLVCFRLAMMLTLLRHESRQPMFDPLSQSIVCTDQDFDTALTIINCLINHTAYVYTNLVPHDDKAKDTPSLNRLNAQEKQLYNALGRSFTTAEAKHTAKSLSIPWKSAERYIGNFVSKYGIVRRIRNGQYQKT